MLTQSYFSTILDGYDPVPGDIAVACSGGPDSIALTLLLRDWCESRDCRLAALIVDHRLRDNSTVEARTVQAQLTDLGLDAYILTRPDDDPIDRDIQNRARRLRYELLLDWCGDNGFGDLFLAHHLDDQAETFMMRLGRGSGVQGLSAMAPVEWRGTVRLCRPLLSVPKADLLALLAERGVGYVRDPSNEKDIFTRVRWRKLMPSLEAEGLTAARLAATAGHMRRASAALDSQVMRHLDRSGRLMPDGGCRLVPESFMDQEEEVSLRALASVVQGVGGNEYPPRFDALVRAWEALADAVLRDDQGFDVTLASCRLAMRRGAIWIAREYAAIGDVLSLDGLGDYVWDRRFEINIVSPAPDVTLAAIGKDGWRLLREQKPDYVESVDNIPAFVRDVWPGLWQNEAEVVPLVMAGPPNPKKVGIRPLALRFFGSSAFSRPAWSTM